MTKNDLNQNGIYVQDLIDTIEPDFVFNNDPIDRFKFNKPIGDELSLNKKEQISKLKARINSIENCNLKNNSNNLILGDGNINSPIMIIGEAPGENEDRLGQSFQGDVGALLKKMFLAIMRSGLIT